MRDAAGGVDVRFLEVLNDPTRRTEQCVDFDPSFLFADQLFSACFTPI